MFWFENPLVLLLVPVAAAALYYVFIADGKGSKRRRYAMFGSRLVVVTLLIVVFAQPFVVETTTVEGDERVQILMDDSDSMEVFEDVGEEIAASVEEEGVDVETTRIADGDSSPLGDQLLSNVERDGNVLLISDGQVTDGRSLTGSAEVARSMNARVSAVNLTPTGSARHVSLLGPSKASEGVEETFEVCVGGVNLGDTSTSTTVDVEGETVFDGTVSGCEEFEHTFDSTGSYDMTASLAGDGNDEFDRNDEFYRTVRVVERPNVLYVSQNQYPFLELLGQLYDVETANEVPSDLDGYYAVVTQNLHANDFGDVAALQEFVIDGGGLFVAGGPNAYDTGGYTESPIGDIVPVSSDEGVGRANDIVLVLDVSANTGQVFTDPDEIMDMAEGTDLEISREEAEALAEFAQISGDLTIQVRATALDVVEQLGGDNRVGLVAAVGQADTLMPPSELSTSRQELVDTIERITSPDGAEVRVNMEAGLEEAAAELDGGGHIIVVSDGLIYPDDVLDVEGTPLDPDVADAANRINARGTEIHTVAIGDGIGIDLDVMRELAEVGGGQSITVGEEERLGLMFGGEDMEPEGDSLVIMDGNHFITQGVETTADLPAANEVGVKSTGRHLVSTSQGDVAMASGRYGLGRVVSTTAHAGNGVLGGLLSDPDSMLVSRGVNWAIGDPERLRTDVYDVDDTRVGETTEVSYRGTSRPSGDLEFSQTDEDEYVATVTPSEPGFETAGGATFAVNYAREYGNLGMSQELGYATQLTGGSVYEPGDTELIAEEVRSHASEARETQRGMEWLPLLLALLVYLVEVCLRRLHDVYGYEISGLVEDAVDAVRSRT